MKNGLLFFTFLFLSISSFSQSFVIHDIQGNNATSTTQYFSGVQATDLEAKFYVINISASPKTVKAYRTEISIIPGTQNAITFDLINYAPNIDTSALSSTVQPGDSVYFEGDYFTNGFNGLSTIQYCFFDVQNTSDQSCLTVNFESTLNGVQEISSANISLPFYPQPASQTTHCFIPDNNGNEMWIAIMDCSGKVTTPSYSINGNDLSINISDYAEGIYFVEIICSNGKRATGKIQIVH